LEGEIMNDFTILSLIIDMKKRD